MMQHTLLFDLITFIVYLVPQAFFINGMYLAAVGSTETMPDGTDYDSGMIFYGIKKYLEQKTMKKVFYEGDMFAELFKDISDAYPLLAESRVSKTVVYIDANEDLLLTWKKLRQKIENQFDVKFKVYMSTITFYREYSEYRFSKYIRKPTFGCVICMSSFWGVFTFLIPLFFLTGVWQVAIGLYLINTPCLAFLNYKIHKPL